MFAKLGSTRGSNLVVELLMLVVGINIALWFEGKFEDYRDAQVEQEYLNGLHDDLAMDLRQLDRIVSASKQKIERLSEAVQGLPELATAPKDVLANTIFLPSGYDFFQPSDFTYRSMQESGDFRLLADPDVKKGLLSLARRHQLIQTLQLNFVQALDDSYIPTVMSNFDLVDMRLADPALLKNPVFRNFFVFAMQETEGRVQAYEAARAEIAALLEIITAQMDKAA